MLNTSATGAWEQLLMFSDPSKGDHAYWRTGVGVILTLLSVAAGYFYHSLRMRGRQFQACSEERPPEEPPVRGYLQVAV